jgi:hypothetical protein
MRTAVPALLGAFASLALAIALTAAEARVVGSGQARTEQRAVADFETIETSGSMDIHVRQAAKEALEITADDNLLPHIETVVENKVLKIRMKRGENYSHKTPVKLKIDVIRLGTIASSGSGDVAVEGLKTPALKVALSGSSDAKLRDLATDSLELRISGSSDVVGAGSAKQVKLSISGSGDAKLADLVADEVQIRIAGSGDADVTANKSLDVSIAGSGDVKYGGNPTNLKTSTAGSGSIRRR